MDSLMLFPDTELYRMAQQGLLVPAKEKERICELQVFINYLNIRTHLFAKNQLLYGHLQHMCNLFHIHYNLDI